MKKILKLFTRMMMILVSILAMVGVVVFLYMHHPKFGAKATGKRLEKMQASPNYQNSSFVNRSYTPAFTEGYSMSGVMYTFLLGEKARSTPKGSIPSVHTDLNNLPKGDWLVWFGHSSYFMHLEGIKVLVDPVFSGNASPIPGSTKAFKGANVYTADDLPPIDYLFITHDHYDHLDYETMKELRVKVKKVVCGLGVGAHLERWGYDPERIVEMDWDMDTEPERGVKIYGLTARHFSGRTFKRNGTLWMSYLLQTPTHRVYIGGDGGYDNHFKEIGAQHGPIDLAILENGQYHEAWKAIHFLPGENLQAAVDLKAKRLMPVHSGKFSLAMHAWDEPLRELVKRNQKVGLPLVTPKIGEPVNLNDSTQVFSQWWQEVDEIVHE